MKDIVSTLAKLKKGNSFEHYIDYIRFPYFKNLEADTKIEFTFPFTVLVGRNGSGKSSILQALFGAPRGNSVGTYWFSTDVDPIKLSSNGDLPCFIYAYNNGTETGEVIKTRIRKSKDPDYWETSRPILKYGMKPLAGGKRRDPINMDVVYKNFRSMLSAFDKHFYFNEKPQAFLRRKSAQLLTVIKSKFIYKARGVPQNKKPKNMSASALKVMSEILGKDYTSGKIIEHKLFKTWGLSVLFGVKGFAYSEAFAGSGEMATATLIHEVLSAKPNSLILLDEPEISLHPGAQKKLRDFLLDQIKLHKHQIIISTHSPFLVQGLPKEAIKVVYQLPNGKFTVEGNRHADEAFYEIGHTQISKRHVYVEDRLAKKMIKEVLLDLGAAVDGLFVVEFCPGGVTSVYQNLATKTSTNELGRCFSVFDGDQNNKASFVDPEEMPIKDLTKEILDQVIKAQTGFNPAFMQHKNNTSGDVDLRVNFLKHCLTRVQFLPFDNPEDALWSSDAAHDLLSISYGAAQALALMDEINAIGAAKEKFRRLAELNDLGDSSKNIEAVHKIFLKRWILSKNQDYKNLVTLLEGFKDLDANT